MSAAGSHAQVPLDREHARALLKALHRPAPAPYCRLYLVDVDVLATYVDGRNANVLSAWSSLYALDEVPRPAHEEGATHQALELADALAKSVSGFLLGAFSRGREAQFGRLWLTPEHSTELDSLVAAVIDRRHASVGRWQGRLYEIYEQLMEPGADNSEWNSMRLEELAVVMADPGDAGAIPRAYRVRREVTSVLDRNPLKPPQAMGSAFTLGTQSTSFARRVRHYAEPALEHLLSQVRARQRVERYFPAIEWLHREFFALYAAGKRWPDLRAWTESSEELRGLIPGTEIEQQDWIRRAARVTAVEVFDCFAIGRLLALGEHLNSQHALPENFSWRVCLLSGSRKFVRMLEAFRDSEAAAYVEILHPLNALRFDEFLRPRSRESALADLDMTGHEYALSVLADPDAAVEQLDVPRFFDSLQALLKRASTAFAYEDDAALQTVRRAIREHDNYPRLVRRLGSIISSKFIETYCQVNPLMRVSDQRLPASSLPWLTLPWPGVAHSVADEFVAALHERSPEQPEFATQTNERLQQVMAADPTGYSAAVCAALGYLSMGKQWLPSAENAANTAARNALLVPAERGDGYVPEGNEALYLSAFVSRMRVSAARDHWRAAESWKRTHAAVIQQAMQRCAAWAEVFEQRHAGIDANQAHELVQLVRVRYQVEDAAREVFCMWMDLLVPDRQTTAEPLWEAAWDHLHRTLAATLSDLEDWRTRVGRLGGAYKFTAHQLAMAAVQFWLGARISLELGRTQDDQVQRWDELAARTLRVCEAGDSHMLTTLHAIHARHGTRKSGQTPPRGGRRDRRRFAELDQLRVPLLEGVLNLAPGQPLQAVLRNLGYAARPD